MVTSGNSTTPVTTPTTTPPKVGIKTAMEGFSDWRQELDEKCWPGYEKKGMKTMFGKRYPNCVKKSKKKK